MEVSNLPIVQQPQIRINDNINSVRPGETSQVLIKERLPENEAKVVLKGQETVVKFDGPIPSDDRVLVEVKNLNENGQVTVKAINNNVQASSSLNTPKTVDSLLRSAGINPESSPELKEAVSQILSRDGNVMKETVAVLQDFFKNEPGSIDEKLNTIKVMQQKNIELTKVQLQAVNVALHGKALTDTLSKIFSSSSQSTENISIKQQIRQVIDEIQKEPQLEETINLAEKLLSQTELENDSKKVIENGINTAQRLAASGQNSFAKGVVVEALVKVERQLQNSYPSSTQDPGATLQNQTENLSIPADRAVNTTDSKNIQIKFQTQPLQQAVENAVTQIKNGTNSSEVVKRILSALDPSVDKELIADIKKAQLIQQAAKTRILDQLEDKSEIKEEVKNETDLKNIASLLKDIKLPVNVKVAIQEGIKLEKIGTERLLFALEGLNSQANQLPVLKHEEHSNQNTQVSAIKETAKLVLKEPLLSNLLKAVGKLLEEHSDGDINLSGFKESFEKATKLADKGRELAARRELAEAMGELEKVYPQLQKASENASISKAEEYMINEAVQTLQLTSKNLLVTEITKKLSQMAIDFKNIRQEISRNLDAASRLIQTQKPGSITPVRQMLDATIKKLDNTILKSNFMLYTDMETEKKMLTASSRLADAKNHLSNGNFAEVNQIVKEVKDLVDKLVFKPSDTRIKHFISEESLHGTKSTEKDVLPTQILADREKGPRHIFEAIKRMGFTHETNAAQTIVQKEEAPHNLKSALMEMIKTGDNQTKMNAEQALSQITGQQLLNKQDSSGMQNLFLQLPLLLDKQVENVKVYVNSQKKGEKIDWENCSLYFVLETKKLGEVGISVSAVNKNLSITFKNNTKDLEKAMDPLKGTVKERLQEIGYSVGSIHVKPMKTDNQAADNIKVAPAMPTFTEKGYDYTI